MSARNRILLSLTAALAFGLAHAAAPNGGTGSLAVYSTLQDFQTATQDLGTLTLEDFEGGFTPNLPSTEFASCVEPVSRASNDACYAPGDLVDGITISSSNHWGVIVLNSGVFSTNDRVIAAWPYRLSPPPTIDFTRVDFADAPTAIGADVYGIKLESGSPNGETVPVQIDAYAADDSLIGSFTVQPVQFSTPVFAGFRSPVPVAYVVYGTRTEVAAAPIDNLRFGGGAGRLASADLDFGPVALGGAVTSPLNVTNAGHLAVSVGTIGAVTAPFAIASDSCSGASLAPGASCTLQITFSPLYQSDFSETLALPAAGNAGAETTLRGTGVIGGGQ